MFTEQLLGEPYMCCRPVAPGILNKTRPKPPFGQEVLAGGIVGTKIQIIIKRVFSTFWGVLNTSLRASSVQLELKRTWNHKNHHGIVNQSRAAKKQ